MCPDGLWAKYVGWTPYQYAGNNPISNIDKNGLVVFKMNLNKEQHKQYDDAISMIRSWNSPTANHILDVAEGSASAIYLYFMSNPAEGNTQSDVGRSKTIEEEWNSDTKNPDGMTLKSPQTDDMKADVIVDKDKIQGNCYDETNEILPTAISPLIILDELNHAIDPKGNNGTQNHLDLYQGLLNEINNGTASVSPTMKSQIEEQLNREMNKIKK